MLAGGGARWLPGGWGWVSEGWFSDGAGVVRGCGGRRRQQTDGAHCTALAAIAARASPPPERAASKSATLSDSHKTTRKPLTYEVFVMVLARLVHLNISL